jgi:hypothetical protein
VARKLHSKEIHVIVGASDELEFPEGLIERCKVSMLGKVMNGHCVRALGVAALSYLHQSPAPAQGHPAAFAIGGQTAHQQHCSFNHPGPEFARNLGLKALRDNCRTCIAKTRVSGQSRRKRDYRNRRNGVHAYTATSPDPTKPLATATP